MSDLKKKVIDSSIFYTEKILNFDYQLADFNFSALKEYFRGTTALELGPASGYMTKNLVNEFAVLHSVDASDELLLKIPDYPNLVKHCAFFEEFECNLEFDTIIMSHVLEHISDPVLILKKVSRWLKNNGVLIVSVPNAKSIHRLAAVEMGILKSEYELNSRDIELGHYRVYDMQHLQKDAEMAGFKIVSKGGVFFKPVSNSQIDQNWTQEMIVGFNKLGKLFPENCAEIFVVCEKKSGS